MHVRVPVTLHRDLELLQVVTRKSTSDVVRELLDAYVLSNHKILESVAAAVEPAQRQWTQAQQDEYERRQLEATEEAAKPENHYDSKDEWDNN
jgi:hypothetical protein